MTTCRARGPAAGRLPGPQGLDASWLQTHTRSGWGAAGGLEEEQEEEEEEEDGRGTKGQN